MMSRPRYSNGSRRHQGFSLVELALVLVAVGLIVGGVSELSRRYLHNNALEDQRNQLTSANVDAALRGFALAHSRLPCPDVPVSGVRDGVEDCSISGSLVQVGYLPVRSLGLFESSDRAWLENIAYGVSRTASGHDLATLSQQFSRTLSSHGIQCQDPTATADCDVNVGASISTITFNSTATDLNILDFCAQLKTAEAATYSSSQIHTTANSTDLNLAYVYALPGSARSLVGGQGSLESAEDLLANNQLTAALTTPNATLDDRRHFHSFADVYQSMGCAARVSGVDATYHAGVANAGGEYLGRINLALMKVQLGVAEDDLDGANRDQTFASIGIVLATADLLISIAELVEFNAAAVAGVAVATAQLVVAGIALDDAIQGVADAEDWVDELNGVTTTFRGQLLTSGNAAQETRTTGQQVQVRGGL